MFTTIMKYIFSICLVLCSFFVLGQYDFDRNDFFEVGGSVATFGKSSILAVSSAEFGDVVIETSDLQANSLGLAYGKAVTTFAHLVFGVSFANRHWVHNLKVQTVEAGDKYDYTSTNEVRKFNSAIFNFGPRIKFLNTERIELSAGGGGFAHWA